MSAFFLSLLSFGLKLHIEKEEEAKKRKQNKTKWPGEPLQLSQLQRPPGDGVVIAINLQGWFFFDPDISFFFVSHVWTTCYILDFDSFEFGIIIVWEKLNVTLVVTSIAGWGTIFF